MLRCAHSNSIAFMAIFTLLSLGVSEGNGDIYHYVDPDGVACFTDTPATYGAVLIIKEKESASGVHGKKAIVPRHLEGTGIGNKIGNAIPASAEVKNDLPITGRLTSVTGFRHDPIDGTLRFHNGVDIAVPSGTPVKPVGEGNVLFSGIRPGYGNMIVIEHDDGTLTIYAHNLVNLSREGDRVDRTITIALTGSSGRATGPHLHFEAWKNGKNITPAFSSGRSGDNNNEYSGDGIRRIVGTDGSLIFTNLR